MMTRASRATNARQRASDDKRDANAVVLVLPARLYRLSWAALLVVHVLVAVFSLLVALLYQFLRRPDLEYYVRLVDISARPHTFVPCVLCFATVSAVNWIEALRMLWHSRHRAHLRIQPSRSSTSRTSRTASLLQFEATQSRVASLTSSFSLVFSDTGVFGIRSSLFSFVHAVRKLAQIGSQIYMAARMSHLVTRSAINTLHLLVIVFNCVSTPLILTLTSRGEGRLRVWCLGCDILSGVLSSVLTPIVIFYPYVRDWNSALMGFDDQFMYDDVWFINGAMDTRVLVSTAALDLVIKIYPFLECWICMAGVKSLLREEPPLALHAERIAATARAIIQPSRRHPATAPGPSPGPSVDLLRRRQTTTLLVSYKGPSAKWLLAFHVLFVLLAVLVTTCHVLARVPTPPTTGCRLPVHPWFTTQYACSVLEINCHRRGIGGNASSVASILRAFHQETLMSVIVMHCPALEIPPELQRLRSLIGFEIYNSTLVHWPKEAALTGRHHPALTFVALAFINLTGIPEGLMAERIDPLMDVEMSRTNLTTLPPELLDAWPQLSTFSIEYSEFTELPPFLTQFPRISTLSFAGNHLRSLPDDLFRNFQFLIDSNFARNPLTAIPPSLNPENNPFFNRLWAPETHIATLPDGVIQLMRKHAFELYVDATPLCRHAHQSSESSAVPLPSDIWHEIKASCAMEPRRTWLDDAFYPLSVTIPHRQL
ncbi:hypothetical protein PINS_up010356 [Pythium insidiosum]|nr:hypothetical protein PINS_up010356 [Pythium insidiosum]